LNVQNGTIDLRTGILHQHKPTDLITKLAPVEYDPGATCPTFEKFVARIMDENPNLILFLQRAVGYSLTGSIAEQVLFMLYGAGSNGKTTLELTLQAMLGDYAAAVAPETLMIRYRDGGEASEDVARLRGARSVFSNESDEGRRLDEPKIKLLTGGDKVVARHLYGHFFEFRPTFKLWFATNHLPTVRGQDEAMWRRILQVPFNVTIPKDERVPDYFEKVLRHELPGILAWAVAGCLLWQKHGLEPPQEVLQATADYRHEQDVVAAFIAERCRTGPTEREAAGPLYKAFREWSGERGDDKPMSHALFGRRLTEKQFTVEKHGTKQRMGLSLKLPLDDLEEGR
jgi:putative DNA primase/helicase